MWHLLSIIILLLTFNNYNIYFNHKPVLSYNYSLFIIIIHNYSWMDLYFMFKLVDIVYYSYVLYVGIYL